MKNKDLTQTIGWSFFYLGFAYWIETAVLGIYNISSSSGMYLFILAPIMEELSKFICYRSMSKYTVAIPIVSVLGESLSRFYEFWKGRPVTEGPAIFIGAMFSSLVMLIIMKHIAFWGVGYFFRFSWWSLPLMVGVHATWNLYWDNSNNTILAAPYAGILALAVVFVALSLRRLNNDRFILFLERSGRMLSAAVVMILLYAVLVVIAIREFSFALWRILHSLGVVY